MNKTTTQETFHVEGLPLLRREQFLIVCVWVNGQLVLQGGAELLVPAHCSH